ncbi:hypothetical protein [Nostoc sp.]|uniref:hypothetical protein n=1 Tax=Nostoc sp. TaxID=1180 RepID=UPI002FF69193
MVNESPKQGFKWKKVLVATSVGAVILAVGTAIYDHWRISQGGCVRFSPDGTEKYCTGMIAGNNQIPGSPNQVRPAFIAARAV